jgi:hypothetical protein
MSYIPSLITNYNTDMPVIFIRPNFPRQKKVNKEYHCFCLSSNHASAASPQLSDIGDLLLPRQFLSLSALYLLCGWRWGYLFNIFNSFRTGYPKKTPNKLLYNYLPVT